MTGIEGAAVIKRRMLQVAPPTRGPAPCNRDREAQHHGRGADGINHQKRPESN